MIGKNKILFLLQVFFVCCITQTFSQNIDSLKLALKNATSDTVKCNILNALVDAEADDKIWPLYNEQLTSIVDKNLASEQNHELIKFYKKYQAITLFNKGFLENMNGNFSVALAYFHKSLAIQEEIKEYTAAANSTNNIGFIYMNMGDYSKALEYYDKSIAIQTKVDDKEGIANSYNNIGYIYKRQWNISQAISYYQKSLHIRELIHDKKGQANSLNNIAVIYESQKEHEKALEYYTKSLAIREELGDKKGIATIYNNLGGLCMALNQYGKALEYFEHSLAIRNSINDRQGIAQSQSNIGGVYEAKGDYKKAIEFYNKSVAIQEQIKDKKGLTGSLNNIASAMYLDNNLAQAIQYAKRAFSIANEMALPEHIRSASEILSKIYSKKGDYKNAYQMQLLFKQMDDSISNENNREITLKKGFQYAYDKKVAADSLKAIEHKKVVDAKLKQEQTQRYALYGGLALVILFAGFIFNRFKITIKQKEIIEIQKQIVEAKNNEITQSIHYAKHIQQAMLTSEEYISKHFNAEYFIFYQPKDIVSGDFYYATAQHNKFYIATADCTGHGVPGAFMSLLNINFLNENIVERGLENPSAILNNQRNAIIKALNPKGNENSRDGMDCVLCAYDLKNMTLNFSAANNPVWLVRSSRSEPSEESKTRDASFVSMTKYELTEYKADKMPVGKYEENPKNFTEQKIDLQKGDTIYTFTDGYADQFGGPKGKKFLYKQLQKILLSIVDLPLHEQKEILSKTINEWKSNTEQVDDILVIGVRV